MKKLTDFAASPSASSLSWRKAHSLYKSIRSFGQDGVAAKNAFEMLWSTWLSRNLNFGADVQLYEVINENPDIACPIVIRDLQKVRKQPLSDAGLVVAMTNACQRQNSDQIKDYRSHLVEGLRKASPVEVTDFPPWLGGYRPQTGPYEAKHISFHEMVYGIREVFREANAYDGLSQELTMQPLWARIVFEGVIAYELGEKGTLTDYERTSLLRWVDLGLGSADRDARYAALVVIGRLSGRIPSLNRYKTEVQRMAKKDEDTGIRETAYQVLVQDFNF